MGREEKFRQHLENKYGKDVTDLLYNDGKITTENIKVLSEEGQKIVQNHLNVIDEKINFNFIENEYKWAFDFSGWTGKIDFTSDRLKKYMVIGLEPHIERFDFQITYGLSDNTPISNESRFSIDCEKPEFIQCKNDSSLIWTNLFKLLASEETIKEVKDNKNEIKLKEFLNQFFITDLCHFAPQGSANLINKVSKWSKIRESVANEFIKKEIEIINPEIIFTQGTDVFNTLKKILNIDEYMTYSLGNGSVRVAQFGNIRIIGLPHIGSTMIHRTFWINNISNVREKLVHKQLLKFETT